MNHLIEKLLSLRQTQWVEAINSTTDNGESYQLRKVLIRAPLAIHHVIWDWSRQDYVVNDFLITEIDKVDLTTNYEDNGSIINARNCIIGGLIDARKKNEKR